MKKALQFLQKHVDVAFATCSDNLPKLRVFRIMKQDDSVLYFATSAQKAVYRELKQNPHVELLASEGDISVRFSGTVCFDVDEATKRWIYEHNNVLSRLYDSYDQLAYFSMNIAEMDYYDLEPTPPVLRHFNLITGEAGNGYVGEKYS
jgi:uncharacterized pyridoxamine 5'-phosphate oxidase family protein